ncbi:hypothetical protein [Anaerotignum lactatifermentans]|uniref:hypothetical protein n=1 Tax=Anaerotignum lactatifermentans TaxID=160404 RepID=UPI001875A99C|nr:hypothetical protein [Anaerotignum lactatifermentans]MBE5075690.1 hypothetical protein [Anaerotignum lactatifermentans]
MANCINTCPEEEITSVSYWEEKKGRRGGLQSFLQDAPVDRTADFDFCMYPKSSLSL